MRQAAFRTLLCFAVAAGGCTSERAAVFPTRSIDAADDRRPPGIVADPPTHVPTPEASSSTQRALVSLAAPVDTEEAKLVVRRFFEAVTSEQVERLNELFDPSGRMWTGRQQRQLSLEAAWARRLDQLDYTALSSSVVFRESDMEVYRAGEAQALAEARGLSVVPQQHEVLVRVSVMVTSAGQERLFGDEVVFLLQKGRDGYKISQMREDFRVP